MREGWTNPITDVAPGSPRVNLEETGRNRAISTK